MSRHKQTTSFAHADLLTDFMFTDVPPLVVVSAATVVVTYFVTSPGVLAGLLTIAKIGFGTGRPAL